jgi:hypothetical protein
LDKDLADIGERQAIWVWDLHLSLRGQAARRALMAAELWAGKK